MNNQTKDSITDNATTESRPFKKTWEEPVLLLLYVDSGAEPTTWESYYSNRIS